MVFNRAEMEQIEAGIAALEKQTAGELVVAVVAESEDTRFPQLLLAGCLAMAFQGVVLAFLPALPGAFALVTVFLMVMVLFPLVRPLLQRAIVGKPGVEERVRKEALRVFAERGIYKTRDKSGVLILYSEFERCVVILGDEGIHRALPDGAWKTYAGKLTAGVRDGRAGDALLEVLSELGAVLGKAFPVRPEDENELPNSVVVE